MPGGGAGLQFLLETFASELSRTTKFLLQCIHHGSRRPTRKAHRERRKSKVPGMFHSWINPLTNTIDLTDKDLQILQDEQITRLLQEDLDSGQSESSASYGSFAAFDATQAFSSSDQLSNYGRLLQSTTCSKCGFQMTVDGQSITTRMKGLVLDQEGGGPPRNLVKGHVEAAKHELELGVLRRIGQWMRCPAEAGQTVPDHTCAAPNAGCPRLSSAHTRILCPWHQSADPAYLLSEIQQDKSLPCLNCLGHMKRRKEKKETGKEKRVSCRSGTTPYGE